MEGTVPRSLSCRWLAIIGLCIVASTGLAMAAPPSTPAQQEQEEAFWPPANRQLLHSARLWEAHQRGDLAQLALQKLVAARPDSPLALIELGELDLRIGSIADATQALNQIKSRFKDAPAALDFEDEYRLATRDHLQLASLRRLIELGRGAQARAALEQLFPRGAPKTAFGIDYYRLLAGTPNGWAPAYSGLKKLAATHPDDPRYQLALAQLLLRRSDTALQGVSLLQQLAHRDDIVISDVDQPLAGALRELGYRHAPMQTVRDYLLRHPDDTEIAALYAQQQRALQEQRLLSRNALAAIEPEIQQALSQQLQEALRQRADADPDAAHALALLQLDGASIDDRPSSLDTAFDDATLAAALWLRRSRTSQQAQHDELAAAELRAALAFHRQDYEQQVSIAADIEALGASDEGEALLVTAIRLDPQSSWLFETYMRRLINHGRSSQALALLRQRTPRGKWTAATRNDLLASALEQRAHDESADGNADAAIADLQAAIALAPQNPWSRYRLAQVYLGQHAPELGRNVMNEGVQNAPDSVPMHYAQALYLSSLDDYSAALAAIDGVEIAQRTEDMNDLYDRLQVALARESARRFQSAGDLSGAAAALLSVEPLATHSVDRASELAYAWIELGDTKHGLALLEPYLNGANATDKGILLAWAEALNHADDNAELAAVISQIRALPSLTEQDRIELAHLQRSLDLRHIHSLEQDQKFSEAREQLDALLAQASQDRELRLARADLELTAHRPQAARDQYAALVAEQPDDLDTRLSYVRALTESGDIALARLQLQAVQERIPAGDTELQLSLARRQLGLDDPAAALQTLQALMAKSPPRSDALLLAGRAELAQRHFAQARDDFEQAQHASEQENDQSNVSSALIARQDIDARLQSGVAAGLEFLHKPGDSGISQLDMQTLPTSWLFAQNYEQRLALRFDAVTIATGHLPDDFNSTALLGTVQAAGPTAALRYSNDRQSGLSPGVGYQTDSFTADIGSTPLGFLLPNIVGGAEWTPKWHSADITLGLSRRAVTGSELSYAGLRDPITGQSWGAVVESGPYAGIGLYQDRYSVAGSIRISELTGTRVLSNQFVGARGATDWEFFSAPGTNANIGLTLNYWAYQHNLQNYTFGSGGYYSPQSYVSIALPLELEGSRAGWSYQVRVSLAYSVSQISQIAFYPNNPGLQSQALTSLLPPGYDTPYYPSSHSNAASYAAYAAIERQVSRNLVIGAMLDIDRTDYYHPTVISVYLRHAFASGLSHIAVPPRPLRPYNP